MLLTVCAEHMQGTCSLRRAHQVGGEWGEMEEADGHIIQTRAWAYPELPSYLRAHPTCRSKTAMTALHELWRVRGAPPGNGSTSSQERPAALHQAAAAGAAPKP